ARDRLLLREASVLGTVIDTDILAITLDDDAVRSPERWRDLEVFVTTHNGLLQFRHCLRRHVVYEGMSNRRRRKAHRRVGEAIEARAGQRIEEWAELLSPHFAAAGARDRAGTYSRLAADRSRAKSANVEAAEFYRRALEHGRSLRMPKPELVAVAQTLGGVSETAGARGGAGRRVGAGRAIRRRGERIPASHESEGRRSRSCASAAQRRG